MACGGVWTVVGGGCVLLEPVLDELCDEGWRLFGGAMTYARKGDQLGVQEMGAEIGCRVQRDGAVGVAPDEKAGSLQRAAQGAAKAGHILLPGAQETKKMRNRSRRAQIFAVGFEALRGVLTLWAGHAVQTDPLHPLGEPREGVGKHAAREREIEPDEGVGLFEVWMGRGEQHQRA